MYPLSQEAIGRKIGVDGKLIRGIEHEGRERARRREERERESKPPAPRREDKSAKRNQPAPAQRRSTRGKITGKRK